jgi:hypothetical protein
MEAIVTGLVLASVSGLTFLAYKHPIAYRKLYFALRFPFLMMFFGVVLWDISAMRALSTLLPLVVPEQAKQAHDAVGSQQLMNFWRFLFFMFAMAYLEFLQWFPELLQENKTSK